MSKLVDLKSWSKYNCFLVILVIKPSMIWASNSKAIKVAVILFRCADVCQPKSNWEVYRASLAKQDRSNYYPYQAALSFAQDDS